MTLYEWSSLSVRLIWSYEGVPVISSGEREIKSLVAWFIRQGSVTLEYGKARVTATNEQWLMPPVGPSYRTFSDDADIVSISFTASWADGKLLFNESSAHILNHHEHPTLLAAAIPLQSYIARYFPDAQNALPETSIHIDQYLKLKELLYSWIIKYCSAMIADGAIHARNPDVDPLAFDASSKIHNWRFKEPFTASNLASSLGLSTFQLNRLFIDAYNKTAHQYFEDTRLESALNMLRQGDMKVKEIAYSLGFKQASHFSRWFKDHTQMTPASYREKRPN
ncbi:helix-turn-helix transcriptional regulator [Cerasicoccus frondis]|uniref:helix-turn-helix transcriptional regulator n=1 Tax=Cerasicoccus frondis TaxID=490090 RepID=UPI002852A3B8|nr:helix-turn-helix transcriptional regulator [Cerasicoccus frondis]